MEKQTTITRNQNKITIENLLIKRAYYERKRGSFWIMELGGRPAALIVDGKEIKVDSVELVLNIHTDVMDEDTIRHLFPEAFDFEKENEKNAEK